MMIIGQWTCSFPNRFSMKPISLKAVNVIALRQNGVGLLVETLAFVCDLDLTTALIISYHMISTMHCPMATVPPTDSS